MKTRTCRRKLWLGCIALFAALLAEVLQQSGSLSLVDERFQDSFFQARGKQVAPSHVAVVALDEETFAAFPDDPMVFWTDRLALAISRLQAVGVQIVGLDMLLSISPERWLGKLGGQLQARARDYDRPFREQLNAGHLVLASTRTGSGKALADYLLPSPDYLLAIPDFNIPGHIGLADLYDEGDGVVRRYVLAPVAAANRPASDSGIPVLSFPALLALRATGLDVLAEQWTLGGQHLNRDQAPRLIPYSGPPGNVMRVSLRKLLADDALSDPAVIALRGRVVLIGVTAAGMNDEQFTPYSTRFFSGRGPLMSGVEVHANIVESLLTGRVLQAMPIQLRIGLLLLWAGLATILFARLPAWYGAALWLAMSGVTGFAAYLAFCLDVLVPVSLYASAGGIAFLAVLGWRLTGEERERQRIRQMFGRYVSAQVVDTLVESGLRPELGGKSQEVTVLFSDIRNFTTISERLNATEVVEMLNTYFERACAVLLAEGGSIDKFIGDAIMVEFGSPLPVPDHAARAIRAALALRLVAAEFSSWMKVRFPAYDLPEFAIGIGLHSGEAVIGNIGSPNRMEFTAIGDTVNLASRLEGMTKSFGSVILASQTTIEQAGSGVVCGRNEIIHVKGREAPVAVFEVLRVEGVQNA